MTNFEVLKVTAFFDVLAGWQAEEDADSFMARFNVILRQRPSSIGRLAGFGCVRGLGALGVWGCGGPGKLPSLFT